MCLGTFYVVYNIWVGFTICNLECVLQNSRQNKIPFVFQENCGKIFCVKIIQICENWVEILKFLEKKIKKRATDSVARFCFILIQYETFAEVEGRSLA